MHALEAEDGAQSRGMSALSRSSPSSSSPSVMLGIQEPTSPLPETSAGYVLIKSRAARHNLIQAFLSKCFPSGWASRTNRSWLPLLSELPATMNSNPLELSGIALAASVIGRERQDLSLISLGLKCYTQGLNQLRKALRHPILTKEDSTLAACMALNLYETIECPSEGSGGYFSHCHGLLALIQARGVERHSSGAGHRLFLGIRVPAILYVLSRSASTILLEPSWMEGPWKELPKTHLDRVTDCLVAAPGILERVPLLRYLGPHQQAELILELVDECWRVDKRLDLIDSEIRPASSIALYTTVPSRINPLADQDGCITLFPLVLSFSHPAVASALTLLWATRSMLWSGLCSLYKHYEMLKKMYSLNPELLNEHTSICENTGSMKCLPALEQREQYLSMAHNVCQSIEYFLQDEMGMIGALSVTPAIGIVIDALKNWPNHSEEIKWLHASLGLIGRKGARVLDYYKPQNSAPNT
ncbi:hypothetical protein N7481_003277 [Penicillium waksmanii]|uniref:uncharacterized protein n=1 Tax=Penicillium waksmanii TaxID=69791 RepID=UPI00254659DD|nr:uncharacterized protein N7481_003277 [Penicillium waksmanii]KAJ5988067.1 hypothetical protein N7481_003277 [Penicillium waksmanii]